MAQSAEQALAYWEQKGLLTETKIKELRASLKDEPVPHRALSIFSAVGAILVGLGVILFVSSHWEEMTPTLKVVVLLAGILSSGILGYWLAYEKDYERTGQGLLFVNVLIYGAAIFLIAQIYHLELQFWWGMFLWMVGTLFLGYILESKLHAALSSILSIFVIGWFRATYLGVGGAELDFLFADRTSFFFLLPIIGVFYLSLGLLKRQSKRFRFESGVKFKFGLLLLAIPMIVSTFDKYIFFHTFQFFSDSVSILITLAASIALALAIWKAEFSTKNAKAGLIALAAYLVFAFALSSLVPKWFGFSVSTSGFYESGFLSFDVAYRFFILHVLITFFFFLLSVWFGTLSKQESMVNLGILGVAGVILSQYFTWAFALLPRSLFFVVGGLVILGFTWFLEKKRRQLIASMQ